MVAARAAVATTRGFRVSLRLLVFQRTSGVAAFAAAIRHIATRRGGRMIFRRLRRVIFHRASIGFRAAGHNGFVRAARLIVSEDCDGKRQNKNCG